MLFGFRQEKYVIEKFKLKLEVEGVCEVIVEQKGLIVDLYYIFLGVLVDGIVLINGEKFVLELKNFVLIWDMDILFVVKKLICLKVNENNEFCLNIKYFYYIQIQG